jgi:hypothetical protein
LSQHNFGFLLLLILDVAHRIMLLRAQLFS